MHNIKILFLTGFCLLISVFVSAQEKTLTLGGKTGWCAFEEMNGVVKGSGRFGYESLMLDTNSHKKNPLTDLLIDFEDKSCNDKCGNYKIQSNEITSFENGIMGKESGLCRGKGGMRLSGNKDSLFGTKGLTGSFTIEFWLKPYIAENGEIIFSWRSSRNITRYSLYQMISASFNSNHLEWEFTNVFDGYTSDNGAIKISSYRNIVPEIWAHHSLSYDQETGLLEYRIDGKLEDMKYITTNGQEIGGTIFHPYLGVVADFDLCPQFSGEIDDFCIQRTSISESALQLRYDTYKKDGGRFVTEPLLLSQGACVNKIDAVITAPDQTAVVMYIRSGENIYNWNKDYPEWICVKNHSEDLNIQGLYFQVACDLYPDGGGKNTPSVTQIDLTYSEVQPPLPPFTVNAEPGDGEVTLDWNFSVDNSAGGYYVYYGERSGEYLGSDAKEGPSPVDVGENYTVTITGLKNGKIYYFAVAAYSKTDSRIMGNLSKEVYARPLKK